MCTEWIECIDTSSRYSLCHINILLLYMRAVDQDSIARDQVNIGGVE